MNTENNKSFAMRKNKLVLIIVLLILFFNASKVRAQFQWPFINNSVQGEVAGSVGEYRYSSKSGIHRFHQGVDLTNGGDVRIYAINSGTVAWNHVTAAARSTVTVSSADGRNFNYIHVQPTSQIINGNVTQVAVGDYIGDMVIEAGWATHLHLEEETTNFLDHNLNPYVDNSPPVFSSTYIPNGIAFYRNGLLKTTTSPSTIALNQTVQVGGVSHTLLYNKIDIVVHAVDSRVSNNGSANGGQIVPSEISWKVLNDKNETLTDGSLRFDGIPNNAAVLPSFHPLSTHPGSPSIHIITSHPRETPYDRFWNSGLKVGETETYDITGGRPNTLDAKLNLESKFPDGKCTLRFNAHDVDFNNDPNLSAGDRDVKVVIDNFRPYIKEVIARKNSSIGNLIYTGSWTWNATTSQLTVTTKPFNDANPTDKIWIQITTSEPVQNLQTNIPWSDIGTYRTADVVANSNNMVFTITYNPITTSGSNPINIRATDYAGNELQTNPAVIPIHQADGTWLPAASPGSDSNHQFKSGLGVCSAAPTGRLATSAVASSTMGTSSSCLYADVSASAANVELNNAVTYTPVTSGSGLLTYSWDFGAGALPATSTSAGAQTVVYSTTGAKTVTLKICDNTAQCITQTKTNIITVGQAAYSNLSVDFDADRLAANTDQTINLTSHVTGAVGTVTYSWDFGDEVTKGYFSDVNPSIAYHKPGNKSIRLTVTDANGSVTKTKNNYFFIASLVSDISVSIFGCGATDGTGKINALSGSVTGGNGPPYDNYTWDFGDGTPTFSTSSPSSVSHAYKTFGDYTVRLTVCDETGCGTGQAAKCVNVADVSDGSIVPIPSFSINGQAVEGFLPEVGLNSPVKFVSTSKGAGDKNLFDYNWRFDITTNGLDGDATPNAIHAVGVRAQEVVYKSLGAKRATLAVDNGGGPRVTDLKQVLTVVAGKGAGSCFANIGDVKISSTCWTDANKPRFTIPIVNSNCPVAKFEVLYWNNNAEIVMPNGVLDFAAAGVTPVFPITADFSFAAMQWDGKNYNTIGYKVQRFTIYGPVTVDAGADKKVCLGSSVQIGSAPVDGKTYKWSSTTAPLSMLNNLTVANPVFNGVKKGTYAYTVTVTDLVGGCSSTDQISITVDQPAVTNGSFFTKMSVATPLNVTTSGGFGSNTYAWSPADNLSSTSIVNPVFTSPAEGDFNYLVSVTDQQGCTGSGQIYVNAFSAPGNLQATSKAYSWVALSWVDRTTNESSFTIRRSVNDALSFVDYASVGTDATAFNDFNVQKDVTYYYQVVANIAGATSKGTNVASAHTGDLPVFAKISAPGYILTQGDYDNDGGLEFVVQRSASVDIYKYLPANQFSLWKSIPNYAYMAVTGDFDNDGDLDILLNPGGVITTKLAVNTNGNFNVVDLAFSAADIAMIDYDSDNDMDLVLDSSIDHPMQIVKNTGSNQFTIDQVNTSIPSYRSTIGINPVSGGDCDNDGDADMVCAYIDLRYLTIFKNNNAIFASGNNLTSSLKRWASTSDIGDFDKDGWLDVISAFFDNGQTQVFRNSAEGVFSYYASGNLKDFAALKIVAQWGDMDSDGYLDFLSSGYANYNTTVSPASFEIFNYANNQFNVKYTGLDLVDHWIDLDGDGDLDLTGGGGFVYINNIGNNQSKSNVKPTPPSNLCVFFKDNKATFSWDPASDSETPSAGLSYNLYVKQNGRFILSPLADLTTGFRKIGKRGNVDGNTSWTLTVPNGASLEWGVQAIDNSFQGSTFTTNIITTALPFCGAVTSSTTMSAPQGLYTPQNCSPNSTVVSNGATLTLTAGTNISLLPGFSVQPGSFLNAKLTNYTPTNSPCYHTGSREGEITAVTETVKGEDEIFIYPNPNNGQFNIEANFPASESLSIEVVTISGLRIRNKQYEDVLSVTDVIDISDASQGLYIVRFVLKNGKVINKKIVKL